ncbi:T9SS type A sorting domain-containing protein [Aequorivita viscosa]|nr:T9SS type A sorting domain-containing protein [Aequorivita viscosa]
MKYILLLLALHVFQASSAQDSRLLDTWYLQNVIVDGQDNFPPVNNEVSFVNAVFSETEFFTAVCDAISGTITYDSSNPEFHIDGGMTLGGCLNTDYQALYLDEFWFNHQEDAFGYEIVDGSNNSKTLTVTNIVGNQAIYGNELLSTDDFTASQFSIHPNPAKNELFLTSKNTTENLKIKIFNIEGKLLSTQNITLQDQKAIEVSQLVSGIYFLNIEDENGNTTIKKFVKE